MVDFLVKKNRALIERINVDRAFIKRFFYSIKSRIPSVYDRPVSILVFFKSSSTIMHWRKNNVRAVKQINQFAVNN